MVSIRTKRLFLRQVSAKDGKTINEAIVETWDQLKKWMEWAQGDIPQPAETKEIMRKFHRKSLLKRALHLAIFHQRSFVGMCGFRKIETSCADIGYWIRKSAQGQGFAREAVAALTRYGFNEMHLQKITVSIAENNKRSIAVAESLGFTLEKKALGCVPPLRLDDPPIIGKIYARFDDKNLPF